MKSRPAPTGIQGETLKGRVDRSKRVMNHNTRPGGETKPQTQGGKFFSKTQTSDNGGDKEPGEKTL